MENRRDALLLDLTGPYYFRTQTLNTRAAARPSNITAMDNGRHKSKYPILTNTRGG